MDSPQNPPVDVFHISTLAANIVSEPTNWKKKTPLKTYSRQSVSPPSLVTASDPDAEGKSRYGRTRKLRPSGDFLSTDRKVSNYMKVHYESQLVNVRSTYSNPKTSRTTQYKAGRQRSSLPAIHSTFSDPDAKDTSEILSSELDLAAPTSKETIDTPLDLQEFEDDSEKETNLEYRTGDLVWASVPGYPYWPAVITRDPVTNLFVKLYGKGGKNKRWHVHFFGDRGFRGWVFHQSLFPFNLDLYQNKKNEALSINESELSKANKKSFKQQKKLWTIIDRYHHSWNSAVSEAQSLMESTSSERLEYFEVTYLLKKPSTMRSWSSNLSLVNSKLEPSRKAPANSVKEPKKRMRSWSSTLSLVADENKTKRRKSEVSSNTAFTIQNTKKCDAGAKNSSLKLHTSRNEVVDPRFTTGASLPAKGRQTPTPVDIESLPMTTLLVAPLNSPHRKPLALEEKVMPRQKPRFSKKSIGVVGTTTPVLQHIAPEELFGVAESSASSPAPFNSEPTVKRRGRPRKYPKPESMTTNPLAELFPSLTPAASPQLENQEKLPLNAPAQGLDGVPVQVKIEKDTNEPYGSPPLVTRSGRKSVKPEILKPTFKKTRSAAVKVESSSPSPTPVSIKQETSSPEGSKKVKRRQSEPVDKNLKNKRMSGVEAPADAQDLIKPPKAETIKLIPKKSYALFAGLKDIKLCSICFKGDKVVRCRGPCALYMHVECGDKPRFVQEPKQCGDELQKSRSRIGSSARGKQKSIKKSDLDETGSQNGSIQDEIAAVNSNPSGNQVPDSTQEVCVTSEEVVPNGESELEHCVKSEEYPNESANSGSTHDTLSSGSVSPEQMNGLSTAGPETTERTSSPDDVDRLASPEETNRPLSPKFAAVYPTVERINGTSRPSCDYPCNDSSLDTEAKFDEQMVPCGIKELEIKSDKSCIADKEDSMHHGPDSFPDTPPPEENGKSPLPEDTAITGGKVGTIKAMEIDNDVMSEASIKEVDDLSGELRLERLDATESITSDSSEKDKVASAAPKRDAKEKGWMCSLCTNNLLGPCFACGIDEGERVRCKTGLCGKVFHLECMNLWPQHSLKQNGKGKLVFNCPAHTCHTCISDNPHNLTSRYLNDKLVRCMKCPTTYHHGNHCVPAGSEILTSTQIICPRHFRLGRKSLGHLNASWCFLCSVGGSLICCELCPTAFHVECLKISPPEGAYICEDCETGRFPLFGEVVWVKLGSYRWWPARILFPNEIPPRLQKLEHVSGEFAVKFYGTYDCCWVNRGRVFLFHEGDGKKQESINTLNPKKGKDEAFYKGVCEANEDFILWNEERNRLEESHRPTMKPPKYIKITSNKPVGSVKMSADADASSLTACECNPDSKDPCGPDSNCINRLLLVECHPETCPAKEKCQNRNFEKRLYPPLVPFRTDCRGWGLKTVGPLKKGDFIIEYIGEMIDEEEYQRRLREMQKNKDQDFYFLTLDKDRMLDAGPKGNLARFMNHSCQPNCVTQKWTVEGNTRVGLFAFQDIPADSELVFNYNLMTTGDNKIECRCGAPNCAGYIGGKPIKPPTKPKDDNNAKSQNGRNGKVQKKRKIKKRARNLTKIALTNSSLNSLSKADTPKCSMCNEIGATIACHESKCSKMYHLSCTHLTKEPKQYICPSHECSTCRSRSQVENCSLCINSYCSEHQEGNMVINHEKGPLCRNCHESDSGSEWSMGGKDDETTEPPALANGT